MLERLLFPSLCLGCRRLTANDAPTCPSCTLELWPIPDEGRFEAGVESLYWYDGPVVRALKRLKYGREPGWAGPLGRLLQAAQSIAPPALEEHDLVIPVPLHWRRLVARGYNQSEQVARFALPRDLRHRLSPRLLVRRRATPPQTELGAIERQLNVRDAFCVPPRAQRHVRGRHVLLIDDVMTTGATLAACRDALLEAGAARIAALALLRTLA